MQDKSVSSDLETTAGQAFEYVVGTMPKAEREQFQARMLEDPALAREVSAWEESLIGLTEDIAPIPPKVDTFRKIQERLNLAPEQKQATLGFWQSVNAWRWLSSLAFGLFLLVSSLHVYELRKDEPGFAVKEGHSQPASQSENAAPADTPNADYLAVLLNAAEQPVLTAVTATEGSTLWLKWEEWSSSPDTSLQLWAKSRRDGQIRPLLVFGEAELKVVRLDQASLRLIKDSSHLIITEEELGGSAIDEPSERVIATGVCIRLKEAEGKT